MVSITSVDLLSLATSLPYAVQLASVSNITDIKFLSYNSTFETGILGPNASATLLHQEPYQAFHEAGVYNRATNSIYITSNYQAGGWVDNPINITVLNLTDYSLKSVRYDGLHEANGGCPYYPSYVDPTAPASEQLILFCDEGDFINPSALTLVDPVTNSTQAILTSFLGRNFSSINDVKQHPETGDLWFTDAQYGYFQDFRPKPSIPPQVYRFEPRTGVVKVVADGFVQPNGIEFSPDFKTLYVTDTGANSGVMDLTKPSTVYAFDVVGQKFLQNRRLFAFADTGIPDGIHTDTEGNVWSSCNGGGLQAWNPDGVLLGKILVQGSTANFAFVPDGLLLFVEDRLWLIRMKARGRDVKRDFGI